VERKQTVPAETAANRRTDQQRWAWAFTHIYIFIILIICLEVFSEL
jgi:hypothetical protein